MVLFFDDQTAPRPQSRARKYIRRFFKTIIFLALLVACSLWALSSLGGNRNALRLGVQDYLTDTTGYLASMETMHNMSFFPVARISFENLTFHEPVRKGEAELIKANEDAAKKFPPQKTMADVFNPGDVVAQVGKFDVAMSFWDMFLDRRRFKTLEIADISINDDIWLPEPLNIKSIKVVPADDTASIASLGSYAGHKFDIHLGVGMEKDKAGRIIYKMEKRTPVTASLGLLSLQGTLLPVSGGYMGLDVTKLMVGKTEFSGNLGYKVRKDKKNIKADIITAVTHMQVDLLATATDITGTVTIPRLDVRDLTRVGNAYKEIKSTLGLESEAAKSGARTVDINIKIDKLSSEDISAKDLESALAGMAISILSHEHPKVTCTIAGSSPDKAYACRAYTEKP